MSFPSSPFKGKFSVGVSNVFIQQFVEIIVAPGAPKFITQDDGVYIIQDDGKFITSDG